MFVVRMTLGIAISLSLTTISQPLAGATESAHPQIARAIMPSADGADLTHAAPPGALLHARRIGEITFDTSALNDLAADGPRRFVAGGRVTIELFPGERLTLIGKRVEGAADGAETWVGAVDAPEGGNATITRANGRLFGTIEVGRTRFVLQSGSDGRTFVREVDAKSFGECVAEPAEWIGDPLVAPKWTRHGKGSFATPKSGGGDAMLDVLVLYTTGVVSNQGGDPSALANNLVASMNVAFSDSSVAADARVVHYAEIGGVADPNTTGDFQTMLSSLQSGSGNYAGVATLRDTHGADLVTLLVDNPNQSDVCGIAYTMTQNENNATQRAYAYSVVGVNCAAGDSTFTHELSHNLSGRHDYGATTLGGCTAGTSELPFLYNHGYTSQTGVFRTIMGSCAIGTDVCDRSADGCPRLARFSSPNQQVYANGGWRALGVSGESDMVTALNLTTPTAAQYKTIGASAPSAPTALFPDSGCYGQYFIQWSGASGTIGWYELEGAYSSNFASPFEIYRGPETSVTYNIDTTTWLRARACNSAGCSTWKTGGSISYSPTCP